MTGRIDIAASVVRSRIDALLRTYPELQDDAEVLAIALEGETDLHGVAQRIVGFEREAITMAHAVLERRTDLGLRFDRYERQADGMRTLLKSLMDAAGIDKLVLPEATVSITKPRQSVVVTDEESIPSQLCKTIRQPDKKAIGDRLKAGEAIPGAALAFGEAGITIRTK